MRSRRSRRFSCFRTPPTPVPTRDGWGFACCLVVGFRRRAQTVLAWRDCAPCPPRRPPSSERGPGGLATQAGSRNCAWPSEGVLCRREKSLPPKSPWVAPLPGSRSLLCSLRQFTTRTNIVSSAAAALGPGCKAAPTRAKAPATRNGEPDRRKRPADWERARVPRQRPHSL